MNYLSKTVEKSKAALEIKEDETASTIFRVTNRETTMVNLNDSRSFKPPPLGRYTP